MIVSWFTNDVILLNPNRVETAVNNIVVLVVQSILLLVMVTYLIKTQSTAKTRSRGMHKNYPELGGNLSIWSSSGIYNPRVRQRKCTTEMRTSRFYIFICQQATHVQNLSPKWRHLFNENTSTIFSIIPILYVCQR